MAIFGNLILEETVQVDDKTRLDATKSFVDKSEADITLVEIEPEAAAGFVDVTGSSYKNYYLDWQYAGTSRTVTVSVRITTDAAPITSTKTIEVLTATDDALFSGDQDIVSIESDILKYVRPGRNSFLDFHRKAQEQILDKLNDMGIYDTDGLRLTKAAVVDVDEVNKWSYYLSLALIFDDLSNAIDDVFAQKRSFYESKALSALYKAEIKLDLNNDGTIDPLEGARLMVTDLVRR
jgi:hypothetical protein